MKVFFEKEVDSIQSIAIDKLVEHPYHKEVYESSPSSMLEESIKRTGDKPIYPIVVVPNPENDMYWVVSGMGRLATLVQLGQNEVEVKVLPYPCEETVKNLIVDLNKQRIKTGKEKLMEFRHYCNMYPPKKGVRGYNRYEIIGKELNLSKDQVKELLITNDFYCGEGDIVLERIFDNTLSNNQANTLKKCVEQQLEKFDSTDVFEKLSHGNFDFGRLDYGLKHLDPRDDIEYDLLKVYLTREITLMEFQKKLEQYGKVENRVKKHEDNKIHIPSNIDEFTLGNAHIIKGDNTKVEFTNPYEKPVNCIIGSPPYGDRRTNGDGQRKETGHGMNGQEYAVYLAETYQKYVPFLAEDGSIYVIVDEYRLDNGSFSCYLEHFVIEMVKRGLFLVGRYIWWKDNPMPRSYADKDMVAGYEMVYRFSKSSNDYYCNDDLFLELDKTTIKGFQEGCTNSDKKGNTTRGTEYYQSHLKKLRNTLSDQTCRDIIKGNVANPEDFFRQEEEKRHTSTSPIYLTSTLILESTRPNDVVVDIWNGVGNTMTSALLLNRKYIGVEMEDNYFQQSVRRLITTEQWLSEVTKEVKNTLKEYTGEITPSSEFSISIPVEQVYVES